MENERDELSVSEPSLSVEIETDKKEIINEIEFYYDPEEIVLSDEILSYLYRFSRVAEDKAYSIYLDNGSLVIY